MSLVQNLPLMITHFGRFGMEIHVGRKVDGEIKHKSKSEVLFVAAPEKTYNDPASFDGVDLSDIDLGDGVYMSIVDVFCYLGSMLSRDCRDTADVISRIDAASGADDDNPTI